MTVLLIIMSGDRPCAGNPRQGAARAILIAVIPDHNECANALLRGERVGAESGGGLKSAKVRELRTCGVPGAGWGRNRVRRAGSAVARRLLWPRWGPRRGRRSPGLSISRPLQLVELHRHLQAEGVRGR